MLQNPYLRKGDVSLTVCLDLTIMPLIEMDFA